MTNNENIGMLSKHCQECIHANTLGDCEGKTNEELHQIPCSRWEFDVNLLDESEDEQQLESENKGYTVDAIDSNVPPKNESPANKFKRISAKRLKRTLYELKLLAQFGRLHKQYEWTQQQADEIVAILQEAIDKVKNKLAK